MHWYLHFFRKAWVGAKLKAIKKANKALLPKPQTGAAELGLGTRPVLYQLVN
jgi:hypothetical protein